MMGVTGVGGIFLRADDPKALSSWYAAHLGVGDGQWGVWQQQAGTTLFSPFARESDYFPTDRRDHQARMGRSGDGPLRTNPRSGRQSDRAVGTRG
jgi:hypothetical protein